MATQTDFGAIVGCLLSASYSELEIVDYLEHVLGLGAEEAAAVVRDVAGSGKRTARDRSASSGTPADGRGHDTRLAGFRPERLLRR